MPIRVNKQKLLATFRVEIKYSFLYLFKNLLRSKQVHQNKEKKGWFPVLVHRGYCCCGAQLNELQLPLRQS